MLEVLLHINPALYNQFIKYLKDLCRDAEKMYRMPKHSCGFRFFQPDDCFSGGTYNVWEYPYQSKCEEKLFGQSYDNTVPTCDVIAYFGWICSVNLGANGYLDIQKNRVSISKLDSNIVHSQQYPEHIYFDVQNVFYGIQNDHINIRIYNDNDFDVVGRIHPILYRIASKSALCQLDDREGVEIDFTKLDDDIEKAQKDYKADTRIENIETMLSEMNKMYKPFEYVEIKDAPFTSHTELKSRLDPSFKKYLESLKNGKVCQFCGEKVFANSQFCLGCGCPVDYSNEKQDLHIKLNAKKVKATK